MGGSSNLIPFGSPADARGLHLARHLEQRLRDLGLAGSGPADDLREALREHATSAPLWDALASATELLVQWSWRNEHPGVETDLDTAVAWLGQHLPEGLPWNDDEVSVVLDGQWVSYSVASGARLTEHPTAPDSLYDLL